VLSLFKRRTQADKIPKFALVAYKQLGGSDFNENSTISPLYRPKWRCSAMRISVPHALRRPINTKLENSAIRDPIQPHLHQPKALGELSQ
jgi:hypothetical protein